MTNNEDSYGNINGFSHAQAKQILRNIKLDITLGNRFSPRLNNLPPNLFGILKKLSDDGYVIGGSVSLRLYGFCQRDKFGDLDLFLSDQRIKKPFKEYKILNSSEYGDDDEKFKRFKIKVPQIKNMSFDIFEKKVKYIEVGGIKFGSPLEALKAKLKYWRYKDGVDFIHIAKMYYGYDEFASKENNKILEEW